MLIWRDRNQFLESKINWKSLWWWLCCFVTATVAGWALSFVCILHLKFSSPGLLCHRLWNVELQTGPYVRSCGPAEGLCRALPSSPLWNGSGMSNPITIWMSLRAHTHAKARAGRSLLASAHFNLLSCFGGRVATWNWLSACKWCDDRCVRARFEGIEPEERETSKPKERETSKSGHAAANLAACRRVMSYVAGLQPEDHHSKSTHMRHSSTVYPYMYGKIMQRIELRLLAYGWSPDLGSIPGVRAKSWSELV